MSDDTRSLTSADVDAASVAAASRSHTPPPEGGSIAASLPVGSDLAQEHPEALVGAVFAGAFLFARILKHITSE